MVITMPSDKGQKKIKKFCGNFRRGRTADKCVRCSGKHTGVFWGKFQQAVIDKVRTKQPVKREALQSLTL